MADLAKRLYGPAAQATSATTRYTVPASTTTIVRSIMFTNTASAAGTVTFSIGTDAVGTRIMDAVSIAADSLLEWQGFLVMAATEILQITCSATTINATINGIETT